MTSTKRRFFLAGGLSVAIAIVLGIMLGMSALAAPAARERGTLELTSLGQPVSIISSDTKILQDTGLRTVTVTVEDPDLNALKKVGDETDDDGLRVFLEVTASAGIDPAATDLLSIDLESNQEQGGITVRMENAPNGSEDFLPIFGDVTIDYANSVGISRTDIIFDRVRNPNTGLIRFEVNGTLQQNDRIHLNFQTSKNEATTVEVAGENDTMQLALPEDTDDQGKYTAEFIVADEVNIDLNDIRQEQYFVEERLRANKEFEEKVTLPADGTFSLTNIPLVETGDLTITGGVTIESVNAETGVVETSGGDVDEEVTVTYNAGEQFTITLDNAPVQGMASTADHTVGGTPDIGTLVTIQGDTATNTATVEVVAPGPDSAHTLYKAVKFNPVSGELVLSVRKDTPRGGFYIGVNYAASIKAEVEGETDTDNTTTTAVLADVRGIAEDAADTDFAVIIPTGTAVDAVAISTGDNGVNRVELTLSGTDLAKDAKVYITYKDAGERSIPAPRGYNPQGSLQDDPQGNLPIVKALAGGTVTVNYEDASPRGKVRESITIDGDAPAFDEADPENGATFADDDVDLTIRISDAADLVDTSTIMLMVVESTDDSAAPSTGDLAYGNLSNAESIPYDDLDVEESNGGYIITINMNDLVRDDVIEIDNGEENFIWWWAQAADLSGNKGVSDAKADNKEKGTNLGNQPYLVTVDLKAPTLAEDGTRTGEWWDPDADDVRGTGEDEKTYSGKLKGDKRDSIRVVFSEAMDGDSVDPSDFRVSIGNDNLAVVDALHYTPTADSHSEYKMGGDNDIAKSVFLVLSTDMDSDATPKVTLAGSVDDLAGRAVSRGNVTAEDGIAPGVTIEVSADVSNGDDLKITVTTDEDITRSAPVLELYIAPDENNDGKRDKVGGEGEDKDDPKPAVRAMTVGGASRVGRTNEWVFSPRFDDDESQTYSVVVNNATDRSGNEGTEGNKDPDKTSAVTFEIDNVLPALVHQVKDDEGNVSKEERGDFRPGEGDSVSMTDPYYITIDWTPEGKEYPGDSQKAVTLTKAVLNSTLADETKTERNLLAEAITLDEGKSDERTLEGEDLASVRNNNKFTIAVSSIGIGDHTLTINGMDSQGNTLKDDAVLKFTVIAQPMFKLELNAGLNLVSIPNNPADDDINAVLGEYEEIDLVTTLSGGVWLAATRDPETGMFGATGTATDLTTFDASRAYYIRTTAPVDVEVDIPAADIIRRGIPSVAVKGGQWNLVPVISILPIGKAEGEIQAGDELDADTYFGSGLNIFTQVGGRVVSVTQGQPNNPTTDAIDKEDDGPTYDNDGDPSTGAEFGMGYWVFYEFDHTILPGG